MAKPIHERVRAAQAKEAKARQAAEYKNGETERRRRAARYAAESRREARLDAVIDGRAEPRTQAELEAYLRAQDVT